MPWFRSNLRGWARVIPLAACASLICCSSAIADETVQVCGSFANNVFAQSTVPGIAATSNCPAPSYNGGGFGLFNTGGTTQGQTGRWQTNAPPGLELVGATANQIVSAGLNDGQDYGGGFYWAGGGVQTKDQTPSSVGMVFSAPSSYFGMQLVCGKPRCASAAQLDVGAFSLYVRETIGPVLVAPIGLWQTAGWVRGTWLVWAWGNSPSGLCSLSASLNGQLVNTTTSPQDVSSWHQCAALPISQTVDTSRYGQGALPLTLSAVDAASVPGAVTKTVYVDNATPTISLSGPTDAPSTAGTQYVTATAAAGPSGVADIVCSLDGGAAQPYPGASAEVPVTGIGQHTVSCYAQNNAVDSSGARATSATGTWSLKIGQPSVLGIAFERLVGLRCRRVRERERVHGRAITIRRHGKWTMIRVPARSRVVAVMRCHPRVVRRRVVVFVRIRRHGRIVKVRRVKIVRVVVAPHILLKTAERVPFGRGATVNGWLGTSTGTAIGGHSVVVLTTPDNGSGRFAETASAVTAADGSWSAHLPPGPSRLVEAVYAGDATTEATSSGQVHLLVPADVQLLRVSPRHVRWGGTVRITGQLLGGYLPPGGALVRLRIGLGRSYTTYGVQEHVTGSGRFATTYTFGAGDPNFIRSFWFQIASLPMGDYPYQPAASRRLAVTVGG